jgi:hypothetical protein
MQNQNFSSIRGLDLTFCRIDQATWLNRTWRPKNPTMFLKDCLNIAKDEKPALFEHYLLDAHGKIQLRSKWEISSRDRGSYYHELTSGLFIRNHFRNDRVSDLLVYLLDHQFGMPTLPLVLINSDKYQYNQAA